MNHAVVVPPSPAAQRLAYAGGVPFVLGALLVWLIGGRDVQAHQFVMFALAAYAATVLGCLGGIHWGLSMRQSEGGVQSYRWGIAPSLGALLGVLMPPHAGLVVLGAMFVGCYLMDRKCYPLYGIAGWLTVRFRMTVVAALSCFLGAAGG